jgi:hypothetical protein
MQSFRYASCDGRISELGVRTGCDAKFGHINESLSISTFL